MATFEEIARFVGMGKIVWHDPPFERLYSDIQRYSPDIRDSRNPCFAELHPIRKAPNDYRAKLILTGRKWGSRARPLIHPLEFDYSLRAGGLYATNLSSAATDWVLADYTISVTLDSAGNKMLLDSLIWENQSTSEIYPTYYRWPPR